MGLLVSTVLAATLSVAAPQPKLTAPFQLLVEPRGTLLVADGASGRIVRIDPRTGHRSLFAQGLDGVFALAYGPGSLYANTQTHVVRLAGGKRQVLARGLHLSVGLAVSADGTIYVSERNRVLRIDARTHKSTVFAARGLSQPLGLLLLSDGSLLVCDSRHGRVVRIAQDGTLEPVLVGLGLPVALARVGDTVYVADHVSHTSTGRILRLATNGTNQTLSAGKIKALSGVAVGRNGEVYASSFFPPFVGRLDASGALRPFGSRTSAIHVRSPVKLEPDAGGTLLVGDTTLGRVLRLDPRNGTATPVGPHTGSRWPPTEPRSSQTPTRAPCRIGADGRVTTLATGLAGCPTDVVEAGDGSLLVAEHDAGRVSRLRADGAVTRVATGLLGPAGLAVVGSTLYVADIDGGAVFAVGAGGGLVRVSR